ncbi:thiaminase II [Clostridium tarantellae]|uniref:Aminopyrimidine aminohydrolase n=1 Tax=Clostridium tarantellae TaxID=39493 RepID=A0A6I1MN05_9CLOT|nr:thiaminase II [Clostridium tarantellae]MPQ44775.1 thiaminase II [Clostridium tarantellae]
MKFTEYLFEEVKDIWNDYLNHKFICELGQGILDEEKFKYYLIQDYLYLKEYAKVFCIGAVKAKTMKEMKFYYSSIKGTMEDETAVHINYLRNFGVNIDELEKYKFNVITKNYTSYMQSIALTGNLKEIAVAIMPCTWSYNYIGKYLINKYKDKIEKNFYKDWIEEYASKEFEEFTERWINYIDELCENINEEEKERLLDIFIRCSVYEMDFWNMAYKTI